MIHLRLPNLVEASPETFTSRIRESPIAHVPLGTIRPQGGHLPLGADALIAQGFLTALAREVGGIVLPPFYLSPSPENQQLELEPLRFPHETYSIATSFEISRAIYEQVLRLMIAGLGRSGISLVVLASPPDIRAQFVERIPDWEVESGLKILWWEGEFDAVSDEIGVPIDHGAGAATSLLMALCPELVQMSVFGESEGFRELTGSVWDPLRMGYADRGERALDSAISQTATQIRRLLYAFESA